MNAPTTAITKRELIAQACGWKLLDPSNFTKFPAVKWNVFEKNGKRGSIETDSIPDYFNDLNAMHEAEKVVLIGPFDSLENDTIAGSEILTSQLERFEKELRNRSFGLGGQWHATAAQRAEAFGKSLLLWP